MMTFDPMRTLTAPDAAGGGGERLVHLPGDPPSLEALQSLDDQYTIDTYARLPLDAVRGEGVSIWDAAGEEYLDLLAGISVSNVGHCHPHVVGALTNQAQWLLHVSNLVHTAPALHGALGPAVASLRNIEFFHDHVRLERLAFEGGAVLRDGRLVADRTRPGLGLEVKWMDIEPYRV